jgi:hypothetical protein
VEKLTLFIPAPFAHFGSPVLFGKIVTPKWRVRADSSRLTAYNPACRRIRLAQLPPRTNYFTIDRQSSVRTGMEKQ